MQSKNRTRRRNRKNRTDNIVGGALDSVLPVLFFVLGKNEISVQNECVATTDSVVK